MKNVVTCAAHGKMLVPSKTPLGTSYRDGWRNDGRSEEFPGDKTGRTNIDGRAAGLVPQDLFVVSMSIDRRHVPIRSHPEAQHQQRTQSSTLINNKQQATTDNANILPRPPSRAARPNLRCPVDIHTQDLPPRPPLHGPHRSLLQIPPHP